MPTHAMSAHAWVSMSHRIRSGPSQFLSEFIAAFGLVSVMLALSV